MRSLSSAGICTGLLWPTDPEMSDCGMSSWLAREATPTRELVGSSGNRRRLVERQQHSSLIRTELADFIKQKESVTPPGPTHAFAKVAAVATSPLARNPPGLCNHEFIKASVCRTTVNPALAHLRKCSPFYSVGSNHYGMLEGLRVFVRDNCRNYPWGDHNRIRGDLARFADRRTGVVCRLAYGCRPLARP